jgi:sirohydrochlorin ferrochelatase
MAATRILLVDNGSLRPEATLELRRLSAEVAQLLGQPVHPVSVLHSHKIDPALLAGEPAVIFEQAVQQAKTDGIDELLVLPLFIGPSLALTEYLPKVFVEASPGAMRLSIRPALFGDDGLELLDLLVDNLKEAGWTKGTGTVLLCDHGSPIKEVTRCRDQLAAALRRKLGLTATELVACSMERREGAEYAFNEPLLEDALQQAKGEAVILMLFLLPGRHAGGDGDVATIAKERAPAGLRWKLSPLLGTHPALPALLFRRHLYSPSFKTTKIAAITTVLAMGLLPVLVSVLAPKDLGLGERLMMWLGGVAVICTALFLFLRAKVWKKA